MVEIAAHRGVWGFPGGGAGFGLGLGYIRCSQLADYNGHREVVSSILGGGVEGL